MLLILCPYCDQDRPEVEFAYAGEAHLTRPSPDVSDVDWEAFLFHRKNPRGHHSERWLHAHGCRRFFNAVRDTVSDHILVTYKSGQSRPSGGDELK
jgi:sarcosine oxidase subunit delta